MFYLFLLFRCEFGEQKAGEKNYLKMKRLILFSKRSNRFKILH